MRMSRLHIQILGTKQSDESIVIRLVKFLVCKSNVQLSTNDLVLHLCRRKGTQAVDEFSQEIWVTDWWNSYLCVPGKT